MRRYQFIGDTKNGMGYRNGIIYDLTVWRPNFIHRLLNGHMEWRVIIIWPVYCPYMSEEAFNQNWKEIIE